MPDGTRLIPELMLTSYLCGSVAFTWISISQRLLKLLFSVMILKMILSKLLPHRPGATELTGSWCTLNLINPMLRCVVYQTRSNHCEDGSNTDSKRLAGSDLEGILASTRLAGHKMVAISQTILSNAFPWIIFFRFWSECHGSLFIRIQMKISQH